MINRRIDDRGVVMSVVVISLLMMTAVVYAAAFLAYSQARVFNSVTGDRIIAYNRAQAGLVDTHARIRINHTAGMTPGVGAVGSDFRDDTWFPAPYGLNLNPVPPLVGNAPALIADTADPRVDVTVEISAVNVATGVREIKVVGLDHP